MRLTTRLFRSPFRMERTMRVEAGSPVLLLRERITNEGGEPIDYMWGEAGTSRNVGFALEEQGDLVRAAELMQVYVDYLHEIGNPDAEQHAAYLDQLRQRLAASQTSPPADATDEG